MKNLAFLIILLFFASCSKDDAGPSYAFIDQNLQGVIDGVQFEFGEGVVEASFSEENEYYFTLYDQNEQYDNVCNVFISELIYVAFNLPGEEGLYELYFDLTSFDGIVVNLVNPNGEDDIPQIGLASFGAIEITSITTTEITGKIDASLDEENSINGNFSVQFCPE